MEELIVYFITLSEPSSSKKARVENESGIGVKGAESSICPSVIISEALAKFFGVDGREMLQTEVLRRIWEYIKVNHLEVGNKLWKLSLC